MIPLLQLFLAKYTRTHMDITLILSLFVPMTSLFSLPMIYELICGTWKFRTKVSVRIIFDQDIVDIKPVNMEELNEVITCAEFHPLDCNIFVYCSSKGAIRVNDMRTNALCDNASKRKYFLTSL